MTETVIRIFAYAEIGLLIFDGDSFAKKYLPSSHAQAKRLFKRINRDFTKTDGTAWDERLDTVKVEQLHESLKTFETLLHDELSKLPIFCCEDEGIGNLSIEKLLSGAFHGYPENVRKHLSDYCKEEIDEAGKCLAYERPTASGFHILRSVEVTIKRYLLSVPGFVMPPLNRQNWGEYIRLLKDNGAAKEVVDTLQNIKDNYRNPLMHPEDKLDMKEAVSMFSLCQGMIETLIGDMEKRKLI